jgi:hypothetical protein
LGTVTLVNGVATFVTNTLSVGTHHIQAVYNGDANNNPSTSTPHAHVVEMPTNVIAGVGSIEFGPIVVYRVVISNPNTTTLYSLVISGSIPTDAVFVSAEGGKRVASGGDYDNGYVTTAVIPELAPGENYTLMWSVQPTAFLLDMNTLAYATCINAQADLVLPIRAYQILLPVVERNTR